MILLFYLIATEILEIVGSTYVGWSSGSAYDIDSGGEYEAENDDSLYSNSVGAWLSFSG